MKCKYDMHARLVDYMMSCMSNTALRTESEPDIMIPVLPESRIR